MAGSGTPVPPLPSAPLSTGSLVSSPSPLHERPPLPAPPPPKRAPPSPWLPWRKSPEHSVAPSTCSPPLLLEAGIEEGDGMVAHGEQMASPGRIGMRMAPDGGMEPVGGEADAGGTGSVMEVSSSDDSSLLVLVLPPSPASSPNSSSSLSPRIALGQQSRQHRSLVQQRLSVDESGEQGRSFVRRDPSGDQSGSEVAARHGGVARSDKSRATTRGGQGRERVSRGDGQQEQRCRRQRRGNRPSPQALGSSNSLAVISVSPGEEDGEEEGEEAQSKEELVVLPVPQWHGCSPPPSCSWSDCSEKRASGATCWSSGVGGGGAVLREALMLSADPPLSSPHPSAASSPSPEMLSRSPFRPRFAGAVALSSGLRGSRPMSEASWEPSTVSPPSTFSPERLREGRSPLLFSSPPLSGSSSPSPQGLPLLRCRSDDAPSQDDEFRIETVGSQGIGAVRALDLESKGAALQAVASVMDGPFTGQESLPEHQEATTPANLEKDQRLREHQVLSLVGESSEDRHVCPQKRDARDDMEPPQVEPLRKAPRNRAVQPSQVHPSTVSWVSQSSKAVHPPKASQPARALPARAPAWGESLPLSPPAMAPPPPGLASSCRQQADLSPPPPVPPMPLMLELVAVPTYAFAPPSPAGRSTSASPSSVRSSPLMAPRALQVQGALPPPPPARELIPSGPGVPPLWSWSDSTLSGSRSDGRGAGASSVCASLSPDPSSPLVGIRFLNAGDFSSSEVSESGVDHGRRLSSAGDVAGGAVKPPSGGAKVGEQLDSRENAVSDRFATAGEEAVPRGEPGRDGGVGGREGRRPRRYFFP